MYMEVSLTSNFLGERPPLSPAKSPAMVYTLVIIVFIVVTELACYLSHRIELLSTACFIHWTFAQITAG